jgi:tetratricopeptide (TPR) repeat protein
MMTYPKPLLLLFGSLALFVATLPVSAQDDSVEPTRKGIELAKQKKYDQAAEEFSQAIKADPQDTKHYLWRGCVHSA